MEDVLAQPERTVNTNTSANAAINEPEVDWVSWMLFARWILVTAIFKLPTKLFNYCDEKARKIAGLRCASKALFGCKDQMICACRAVLHIDRDSGKRSTRSNAKP